ncbi:hypothetical protein [Prochlorococcus sp. MIT 0801]|uniref:hypothetical protein n=1 Tax=Prochlorococcus sp. MIT 0801 TaxID=1501269 RepID=UPI0004F74190|nr:hypothetical protein [Prochlorococcus sp. MIT 0801]AIQ96900.1 hypothetical protein EW15_0808 [Prochlorococcus sp. MIT 0801]
MPSIRKRIGYLPSINAQKTITKIAIKEKLSQSKVVGILVEEALMARVGFDLQNSSDQIVKNLYCKENNIYKSSLNYNDLDELISDKGITYNKKKYNYYPDYDLSESKEDSNEKLIEQFKQFILFQKMIQDK